MTVFQLSPFLTCVVQTAYVLLHITETLARKRSVFEHKFISKIRSHGAHLPTTKLSNIPYLHTTYCFYFIQLKYIQILSRSNYSLLHKNCVILINFIYFSNKYKNRNIIFNFDIPDEKNLISKYIKPLKTDIWRPVEESDRVRLKMETKVSETCTCKKAGNISCLFMLMTIC